MPNSRQHETALALQSYFPGASIVPGPSNITVRIDRTHRYVVGPVAIRKEKLAEWESTSYRADKNGVERSWIRITSYGHTDLRSAITAATARKDQTPKEEA